MTNDETDLIRVWRDHTGTMQLFARSPDDAKRGAAEVATYLYLIGPQGDVPENARALAWALVVALTGSPPRPPSGVAFVGGGPKS